MYQDSRLLRTRRRHQGSNMAHVWCHPPAHSACASHKHTQPLSTAILGHDPDRMVANSTTPCSVTVHTTKRQPSPRAPLRVCDINTAWRGRRALLPGRRKASASRLLQPACPGGQPHWPSAQAQPVSTAGHIQQPLPISSPPMVTKCSQRLSLYRCCDASRPGRMDGKFHV